jgi:hypothetical protein
MNERWWFFQLESPFSDPSLKKWDVAARTEKIGQPVHVPTNELTQFKRKDYVGHENHQLAEVTADVGCFYGHPI